jgi:hypothetical protein
MAFNIDDLDDAVISHLSHLLDVGTITVKYLSPIICLF